MFIGDEANPFKADPEDFRDEIERLEAEQADSLVSLKDGGNVVAGPWLKNSAWGTPAWGAAGYRYRRMLEWEAYREQRGEAAGVPPGTLMQDGESAYVEAAVGRILDKLTNCPPKSQDTTMNTVAFELNRLIAGNWPGTREHDLKGRFLQACSTLIDVKSPKGKWTPRHFEEKWQRAKRDASTQPKTWPPESYTPMEGTAPNSA